MKRYTVRMEDPDHDLISRAATAAELSLSRFMVRAAKRDISRHIPKKQLREVVDGMVKESDTGMPKRACTCTGICGW